MLARSEKPLPPEARIIGQSLKSALELIGDPKKVAQEMADFRQEARSYDPMPDKILILGRQTLVRKAA